MVVKLAGADGKENPFNPIEPSSSSSSSHQAMRGGLFGSALAQEDKTGRSVMSSSTVFHVTMDGAKKKMPFETPRRVEHHPHHGGGGGGGRGGNRGGDEHDRRGGSSSSSGGGGKGGRIISAVDLDDDLDSYMKAR